MRQAGGGRRRNAWKGGYLPRVADEKELLTAVEERDEAGGLRGLRRLIDEHAAGGNRR